MLWAFGAAMVLLGAVLMGAASPALNNVRIYEYCRVEIQAEGDGMRYEAKGVVEHANPQPTAEFYKKITGKPMPDPKATNLPLELLNDMAVQGWEVVEIKNQEYGFVGYLLKRQRQ